MFTDSDLSYIIKHNIVKFNLNSDFSYGTFISYILVLHKTCKGVKIYG